MNNDQTTENVAKVCREFAFLYKMPPELGEALGRGSLQGKSERWSLKDSSAFLEGLKSKFGKGKGFLFDFTAWIDPLTDECMDWVAISLDKETGPMTSKCLSDCEAVVTDEGFPVELGTALFAQRVSIWGGQCTDDDWSDWHVSLTIRFPEVPQLELLRVTTKVSRVIEASSGAIA